MRILGILGAVVVLGAGALFLAYSFFYPDAELQRFDRGNPPTLRHIRQVSEALSAGNYAQLCEYAPAVRRVDWGEEEDSYLGCSSYKQLFVFEHCPPEVRDFGPLSPNDRWGEQFMSRYRGERGFDQFCGGPDLNIGWAFAQAVYFDRALGRRLIGPCADEDRAYGCVEPDEIAYFVESELGYASYGDFLAEVAFMHLVNENLEAALIVRSRMHETNGMQSDLRDLVDQLIVQSVIARFGNNDGASFTGFGLDVRYARPGLPNEIEAVFDDWVVQATSAIERGAGFRLPEVSPEVIQVGTPLFCTYSFSTAPSTGVRFAIGKVVGDSTLFPVMYAHITNFQRHLFRSPGAVLTGSVAEHSVLELGFEYMAQSSEWEPLDSEYTGTAEALLLPTVGGFPDLLGARELGGVSDVRSWAAASTDVRFILMFSSWFPSGISEERTQNGQMDYGGMAVYLPFGGLEAAITELDSACPH